MRGRRRREPALRSSPFVVLSDMTIGLTFFFAVFSMVASLANSQALAVAQRTDRQTRVREEVAAAIVAISPGAVPTPGNAENGDIYTVLKKPGGGDVAQIWENGNFQRIRILDPVYRAGSDDLSAFGRSVVRAIAPVLKRHAGEFAYVFVHGIAERGEPDALGLSRRRADEVSSLLSGLGVISPPGIASPSAIEAKYAITYGTGSELYTLGGARGPEGGRAGRVDVVLFFKEADGSRPARAPVPPG